MFASRGCCLEGVLRLSGWVSRTCQIMSDRCVEGTQSCMNELNRVSCQVKSSQVRSCQDRPHPDRFCKSQSIQDLLNVWTQNFLWMQKFSNVQIFWTQNLFAPDFYRDIFDQTCFKPKTFGHKNFLEQKHFGSTHSFYSKILGTALLRRCYFRHIFFLY